MDDHFAAVLGTSAASGGDEFIPSKSFSGPRPGYVFSTGDLGTGYYLESGGRAKRQRPYDGTEDRAKRAAVAEASMDADALLEAAEEAARGEGAVVDFDLDLDGLKVKIGERRSIFWSRSMAPFGGIASFISDTSRGESWGGGGRACAAMTNAAAVPAGVGPGL